MDIRMGLFIGLKSAQEFLSSLVIFLTLGGKSLPKVSEKSPFVRADCFFKSHTALIYFTKDKRTW